MEPNEDMKSNEINCMRTCKNTCAMLNEALRKEASIVRFYESLYEECNFPENRNFTDNTKAK
jgi:hypothetical protein